MSNLLHLTKRFVLALDRRELSQSNFDSVRDLLLPREFELWLNMPMIDQKHSLLVMRRFLGRLPNAEVAAVRASLLHDVGKTKSNLGVCGRVTATIVGRRGERFSMYHDHETIGAKILREIGSDETTWRLVVGESANPEILQALHEADDI